MMIRFFLLFSFVLLSACTTTSSHEDPVVTENTQFQVAQRAEERGQYAAAIRIYERMGADDTEANDRIKLALGRLYYKVEDYRKAHKALYFLKEDSPQFHEAQLWLTRVYLRLGQVNDAQTSLSKIPADEWGDEQYFLQAIIWDNQRKHSEARDIYAKLLKKNPFDNRVKENMARSYFLSNDYKEAEKRFHYLVEISPRNRGFIRLLALSQYRQHDMDKAVLRTLSRIEDEFTAEVWLKSMGLRNE